MPQRPTHEERLVRLPPGEEPMSITNSLFAMRPHLLILTKSAAPGAYAVWRAEPGNSEPTREWTICAQETKPRSSVAPLRAGTGIPLPPSQPASQISRASGEGADLPARVFTSDTEDDNP